MSLWRPWCHRLHRSEFVLTLIRRMNSVVRKFGTPPVIPAFQGFLGAVGRWTPTGDCPGTAGSGSLCVRRGIVASGSPPRAEERRPRTWNVLTSSFKFLTERGCVHGVI
jgi:hypothetical protein